ncbi:dihydropteroate synthase [Solitalea koreensis]|uniref:Dihydropteroate synthase n=1 Tax=Solitalea koreensis TaxID=543615 RepID=A0A521CL22_9SPHI|nr:dihydropteroate synthase [Solitalea koreensis]SMO59421.1 Dihydropteroate synthase [Solitalea koreensis]
MHKNTFFSKRATINCGGHLLDLSTPKIMGILNITPDSFFDGGRYLDEQAIVEQSGKMLDDGASIIDVGAYSSRPNAIDISAKEEIDRLLPALTLIKENYPNAIISVDTFRSEVAEAGIKAGGHIINDISAGELDGKMFETVSRLQVPYILMHMRGTPQTMQQLTDYNDLMREVVKYFVDKVTRLKKLGVHDLILDPGFGFAKNIDQNYELLKHMDEVKIFDLPLLAGLSRKSMIWKLLESKPEEALNGTSVLNTIALQKGAAILRVHDVKEAAEVLKIWMKVG